MSERRTVPDAAAYGLPAAVSCPFCEKQDTELHSPFGPQLSVATYWCRRCHTAFDYVKWAPRAGGPTGSGQAGSGPASSGQAGSGPAGTNQAGNGPAGNRDS